MYFKIKIHKPAFQERLQESTTHPNVFGYLGREEDVTTTTTTTAAAGDEATSNMLYTCSRKIVNHQGRITTLCAKIFEIPHRFRHQGSE